VELEPLRTRPEANVTIVFSSAEQNGILMYDGQDAHLAVELFNGRIRVSEFLRRRAVLKGVLFTI